MRKGKSQLNSDAKAPEVEVAVHLTLSVQPGDRETIQKLMGAYMLERQKQNPGAPCPVTMSEIVRASLQLSLEVAPSKLVKAVRQLPKPLVGRRIVREDK